MITGNTSNKISKLSLGWTLISISTVLALNAFFASRVVDTNSRELLGPNFYISSKELRNQRLMSLFGSQVRGLEFMVWERERSDLSRELSQLLWQRINLDPYYGSNWLQLIYLQKEAGASSLERAWTLERAASLLKWNIQDRVLISHYCIAEYADFIKLIPDTCSSLILNLPSQWPDQHKADRTNVRLAVLRSVLALERTRLGLSASKDRRTP
jgi:hypothetical protein